MRMLNDLISCLETCRYYNVALAFHLLLLDNSLNQFRFLLGVCSRLVG